MTITTDAVADLRAALHGPDSVLTDPDVLRTVSRDEADLCRAGVPLAVVRPRDTAEVAAVVRVAAAHGLPVVPQGARTGLVGGANAADGAVVVSLARLKRISVDAAGGLAVVGAGVVNADLGRAVALEGLDYPPDPGSWESSTIGGNVATNAGGMCCVKYGVTGRYVAGLTVVLADGAVLRCGGRGPARTAGYDLTGLFTGSEGTLGIITEIVLRLRPARCPDRTLAAVFPTVAAACRAVTGIMGAGLAPSLLELMDQTHLRAVEDYRPSGLDTGAGALLLAASDAGSAAQGELDAMAAYCERAGAGELYVATDRVEAGALLAARRLAHPAMEHLAARRFPGGGGGLVVDDVAVPRDRVVDLVEGIARIAERHDVLVGVVGHAGAGNLHPVIVVDRSDPAVLARGREVFDEIMRLGLALGGTCTGEHGVGLLKRDWLARELGPVGVRVHQAVKRALDPAGILNPGKVVPPAHNGS
ncbi:FAD-binding protein [Streptomyces sp. NBC_01754]|uniref:FAD-binding oxidoreductase n=1 Tax=Streptomyces sp. NBC_01754 TaxID=2975930 RepID=UPI002DDA24E4|nr:FAD-linked oxidase C-terminal domain-containing protein [Streptomyces sp. NBC_01754]WSC90936.1 FAD-binding protein [Streptomyces sp. NBC_01754]WSC96570.1 FAD-binding protein [Streptomyces sp. NBC_01754]